MIKIWTSDDATDMDEVELISPLRKKKYKAVKYGTWTEVSRCGNWICSNCSNGVVSSKPYDYCPNCGAGMKGEKHD